MEQRAVLRILLLGVFLTAVALSEADGAKHKKIVIKVPKKINHIHHHHVKKVHIWKHKPKPIHSVHVVEEEEPISDHWKEIFDGKKHKFSNWHEKPIHEEFEEEEEEEEYEEEDHEEDHDGYKKSGSSYDPVVWKGSSNGRKQRTYRSGGSKKVRGKPKNPRNVSYWKGERPKRQKNVYYKDDKYIDEPMYKKPKAKKPKSTKGKYKTQERRPKPKPYRPKEKGYPDFKEYEYPEYDDYSRNAPVWPERKEHISWHLRGENWQPEINPIAAEETSFSNNLFQTEHKGEISLVNEPLPDIPVVPPPKLVQNYQEKPIFIPNFNLNPEKLPNFNFKPEKPKNSGLKLMEHLKSKPMKDLKQSVNKAEAFDAFKTQIEHEEGVFSGYSSHVGHNSDGNSASFQSVRFGEKKKPLH